MNDQLIEPVGPDDFIYHWERADINGAIFGSLSGLGYSATLFLPLCVDAGFEMGASFFISLHWWTNPGYTLIEKIIGPIPDYLQILLSIYYMYTCITKHNVDTAALMVNWVKYLQAAFLPYVTVRTFMQGPRHDMFTSGFTIWKFIFNIIDASVFMNEHYDVLIKIEQELRDIFD